MPLSYSSLTSASNSTPPPQPQCFLRSLQVPILHPCSEYWPECPCFYPSLEVCVQYWMTCHDEVINNARVNFHGHAFYYLCGLWEWYWMQSQQRLLQQSSKIPTMILIVCYSQNVSSCHWYLMLYTKSCDSRWASWHVADWGRMIVHLSSGHSFIQHNSQTLL